VDSKEIKQGFDLLVKEELTLPAEIHEKVGPSLEDFDEVEHDKLLKILPPIKDNQHHGTSILHGFEDPFMQMESARDENFNFFKFISLTISMWA